MRSFSLPKIKNIKQDQRIQSNNKIISPILKTKWSMAPKCLVQGHDGKDIMYICINPNCKQMTRLVCETCFFKDHKIHNQQFLAIDQIKAGSIDKLRYWPFQQKFRKIFEFVTKHQSYINNMIQDVNATFNGMAIRIINSIDKIRLNILKKIDSFYIKQSVKKEFCDKVNMQLEKCFELKQVQEAVKLLFNKEIKHSIFSSRMKNILNNQQIERNRQMLIDYFDKEDKGKDMHFDKMFFLKKQNWIIEQIQQQKKTLRQVEVTIDEAELGIEKVIPQTIAYISRYGQGKYPLTFDKKVLEDDSEYTGFYQKGDRTLIGMRKYKNGFVYYGQWRINSKNGWGTYQNKSTGYKYSGCWKEDKRNGYGREETMTSIYEGNYVGDKKEGFGVLMENGIRYEITWKGDKKHGAGKKILKDGTETEIYYLNGVAAKGKGGKSNVPFDLQALTKRFSSKEKSIPETKTQ